MNRFLSIVASLVLSLLPRVGLEHPNVQRANAENPIIWADVPDPSAIRVGDTYYMSSTTMHLSPGLPIMKSTDLVNWHIVGYAYDTLEENDSLNLRNGKDAYGQGSWASQRALPAIVASDEFSRRPGQPALPLVWQWNHNPDNRFWSITERPGYLRMRTGRVDNDILSARNTLTQRTFGPQCSGTIAMDVSHMNKGDYAGLALLQRKYGFIGVKAAENALQIVMVSGDGNLPVEVQNVPVAQKVVYLKAECDFRNRTDRASFYYSLDGKVWTAIGKPLHMLYTLPHFMGYRFALFNFATQTAGGSVDFDYFRVSAGRIDPSGA